METSRSMIRLSGSGGAGKVAQFWEPRSRCSLQSPVQRTPVLTAWMKPGRKSANAKSRPCNARSKTRPHPFRISLKAVSWNLDFGVFLFDRKFTWFFAGERFKNLRHRTRRMNICHLWINAGYPPVLPDSSILRGCPKFTSFSLSCIV